MPRTSWMPLGCHHEDGRQKHPCEHLVLNRDSHDHVVFGRAALRLHGYHLNGVAMFFCSFCSIEIHQAHALFSWNTVKWYHEILQSYQCIINVLKGLYRVTKSVSIWRCCLPPSLFQFNSWSVWREDNYKYRAFHIFVSANNLKYVNLLKCIYK